ncbi:MAG: DUF4348 domain-containing protein [Bacteroidales bacterium]|nr:DUF4348 domain-containing protein [Bacteroidales bacterium]MCM1147876.1 DUF4348 domain-containing protein [Bacteroidales bacterium]MCM1206719.1 DUF4348 domain-containing protein [Bacillota bacterium]MCM1510915.1 DUF4348 domain-containing protein [Clostridium sp.]
MRRSVYVIMLLSFLTIMWTTTGCNNKATEPLDGIVDTSYVDTSSVDTLESLIEETIMPKAADELFDDFIFNFAANKKLQQERIVFPLHHEVYGTMSSVDRRHWHMDHFFMRQGFYTMVVGNMKDLRSSKDTEVSHVVLEKIYLTERYVKQYVFDRIDGLWRLQMLRTEDMAKNKNGDFYMFYDKFVNDSTFRHNALAESVEFSGPDPDDDFSRMEGSIMPEQWSMFAPELPREMIYNIIYGNLPKRGDQRILVVRGISNGFETELTFKKTKDGFMLVKLTT